MSENKKFFLSSFISILVSIFLIVILWNKISLPYSNKHEVIGIYSENNHHQFNDTLRFIIFISLPLLVYLFNCILFKKKVIANFCQIFDKNNKNNIEQNKDTIIFSLFFLFLLIGFFLSKDFTFYELDLFHEGQYLGGGFNFLETGNLWIDNFVVTGLFVDVLLSPISWEIFNQVSIGSTRLFISILNLILQFFLIFFFYNLVALINFKKYLRLLFLIPFFLISLYFVNSNYLNFRDIPIIISLSLIILLLIKRSDRFYFKILTLGVLSPVSILLSIEKGLYLNFLFVFLILTFFFIKEYKWILYFIIFTLLSWICLYITIGKEEFFLFVSNSIEIAKYTESLNGVIYPKPFSGLMDSSRATKNLIVLLANGIVLISFFIKSTNKISNNFKIFSVLFFLESLVFYKTGLSRSDGGHLKQGIALGYVQLLSFFTIILKISIEEKSSVNIFTKLSYLYSPIIFFILISYFFLDLNNIKNFNKNFKKLINANDSFFLNVNDKIFLSNANNFLDKSNCIQVLNYEPAFNYLLKKRSCTRYNLIFAVGSKFTQENLLKEISEKNVEYIVLGGKYDTWGIDPRVRYPYIYKYLDKNYNFFYELDNKMILKKKN